VGDGVWDVRAARELGWRFIGIAAGEQAERLREAGAGLIVPNYCPVEAFLALLLGDD
jgi:phosphoglycolate phosphatase-like HAD superfamily hydrolase